MNEDPDEVVRQLARQAQRAEDGEVMRRAIDVIAQLQMRLDLQGEALELSRTIIEGLRGQGRAREHAA